MPQIIKVNLREGSSVSSILATDVMSMVGVKPGANGVNAISGFLTNESSTVPTANDGSGGDYSNSGGTFKVYNGTTDVTGTATYSVLSSTGVTISIAATGVYTVTGTTADQGTATLRAIYSGVTIDKIYDISRAKSGTNGTNGTGTWTPVMTGGVVRDSTDSSLFYKASGTSDWNAQVYSTQSYTNGAYVSFSPNSGSLNQHIMVGLNTDANYDASYASIDYAWYLGGGGGNLLIYESGVQIATVGTYTASTALSITYDGISVKYYKDGTLQRTIATANQTFFLDSSFYETGDRTGGVKNLVFGPMGSSGTSGTNGTSARAVALTTLAQAFAYAADGTTPSPTSTTLTATGYNTSGTVYYEFLVGSSSQQNTTTNTYTYTPPAAFSSMPQTVTVKLREGSNSGTVLATDVMSMVGIKPGTNGVNAISGFLTNESSTVTTANNGTGGDYSNSGGTFKVYNGITDVTGSPTYSVVSSSGVTISIVSTGIYTVTGTSADQGTATLRATYGGVNIDKIYDISRAKTGAAGASITGATGPKATSGYIYYSSSTGTNPGTPSASSFNFSDGSFSGLTGGWSTTITMTGNGTYWASRYNVTESGSGTGSGTPSFSYPYTHQNFSGLVTFTDQSNALSGYATNSTLASYATTGYVNSTFTTPTAVAATAYDYSTYYANQYAAAVKAGLATQGYTAINGGNISTGTLSVDKIQTNSLNGQTAIYGGYNQFGFGTGTVAADTIATVGYFSTTDSGTLGLGVMSANNTAFIASTIWSGYAGGFGNRYGYGMNAIATANNLTLAQFASYNTAGHFYHRDTGYTINLATSSNALEVTGPATMSSSLSVGSLTVNGVSITTNGGGYGYGSNPVFGALSVSSLSVNGVSITTNGGGSSGYGYGSSPVFGNVSTSSAQGYTISLSNTNCSAYATDPYYGLVSIINNNYGFNTNGEIYAGGVIYSQGSALSSSIRYKTNVVPIDIGLDFILSLEPVKFNLKSNNAHKVGFIAENFPDARFVAENWVDANDRTKGKQIDGIDYSTIVAPLVKAVQELNAKVTELTAQLEILKAK